MTKRITLAALLMLVASAALAQLNMPPGKWWRRAEIVREMNLSEEQQDRLENVFAASASDLIDLRGEVEKQSIALRAAIDRPQLDRDAIRQLAQRLNDARGRQFQRELMMLVDMRGVLTDAQWNRMRNALDRLGERRQDRPNPQQEPKRPMRPRPRM
ncbi:MAG: periplasmic heavy metal sensor [Acidobacteriota bacterium]